MQFKELSEEQLGALQFASKRERKGKNAHDDLLKAVNAGKTVQVDLEEGKAIRHLKWGISQAAKRADMKLDIKVLADQSGVVVSLAPVEPTPEVKDEEPAADAPAAGPRSRK